MFFFSQDIQPNRYMSTWWYFHWNFSRPVYTLGDEQYLFLLYISSSQCHSSFSLLIHTTFTSSSICFKLFFHHIQLNSSYVTNHLSLIFIFLYSMHILCDNQSIKSSFVKGAGAHPQNAPCRRRSNALRSAPVRRGRLLSTVLHRWSPQHSILSAGLR